LGFIGAKLSFPLNNPLAVRFSLDGLDVSLKIGDVIISGSFFKAGIEYAGSLTVDVPKASFSAMGFYGPLRVFNMSPEPVNASVKVRGMMWSRKSVVLCSVAALA
jgi:hypothetical protein